MTTTLEKQADGPRSTVDRTAAATTARRARAAQRAARRAAVQMGMVQVETLDDAHLVALAIVLLGEARRRGLEVPDPDE